LCRPNFNAKYFLYYIPLLILISTNIWFGVRANFNPHESILNVLTMLCVGFVEEIIFRGLESLTNGLDVVELEKTKEDCNSVQDELETKLTEEILKKSPENIAYLIGLDVQGLQVSDFKPTELKQMILDYIRKLNRTKRTKFIIKVKNLPNKL